MRTVRPVSAVERAWLAAEVLCPPFVIDVVVEGDGVLEPGVWAAAAALVGRAHPAARVVLRGVACGMRWADGGAGPPVRTVDGRAWDGRGCSGAPFLEDRLPPRQGVVEVVLAAGPRPRLVVRAHHAAVDGRGLLALTAALCAAARGEAVSPVPEGPTDLALARDRGARPAPRTPERALAATGRHDGAPTQTVWGRRTVVGRWSDFLGRIAVAVARHARRFGEGEVMVHVPVDLRRELSGEAPIGNLTGMVALAVAQAQSPSDVTASLRGAVAQGAALAWVRSVEGLVHLPLGLVVAVGRRASDAANRTGRYGATAILSNLGAVDPASFAAPGFAAHSAFVVPPGGRSTAAFLTALRVGERTEIVVAMPAGLASGGRLDALLDAVVEGLAPET